MLMKTCLLLTNLDTSFLKASTASPSLPITTPGHLESQLRLTPTRKPTGLTF